MTATHDTHHTHETLHDEWLWGWDATPGIVSVHATLDGRVSVWRRITSTGTLVREEERWRPWLLVARIDDVLHGTRAITVPGFEHRELDGPGGLRHLVSADDGRALAAAVLRGASDRLGRTMAHVAELDDAEPDSVLSLVPDEQYLVASGRTYFRDLPFDALHRLQFDLETTGLDARRDRVFMISVRRHDGSTLVLEARDESDAAECELITQLTAVVRDEDPDVIENHNLHGFDLPFLDTRARTLRIPLSLGRIHTHTLGTRPSRRGMRREGEGTRRMRFTVPGRELVDTLDATRRYDMGTRDLPGHGLKVVAKHLGLATATREYIPGAEIHATYRTDPERVRRYATDDVEEVAAISRVLGGAAFALASMVARRYERLTDAGPATGIIDPLLVRAYLRAGAALPAYGTSDGTSHSGAALYLFATGVAHRVVKADVASLYPSLMRTYRIGPSRDRLGALLALVDRLVERRLEAKELARVAAPGSSDRHSHEAMSAALKMVVNSAYGYLGAGGLTRFADVHAANEVTRRGRETLDLMCRELSARGATLIEADTDGVYFAVPDTWSEDDEARIVREVDALLPPLVRLELEGRYVAMLSHEPKNYALLKHDGTLILRGVAFRSSRSEPYGERFLRRAIPHLLRGDVVAVRAEYVDTIAALRARGLPTFDVSSRVRLTKSPADYRETSAQRRELPYEAMLASGRSEWSMGERVHVYRRTNGEPAVVDVDTETSGHADTDARDYDVEYYVRLLRASYAERMARAFAPEDFATVFASADQLSLFDDRLETIRPILTTLATVVTGASEPDAMIDEM